MIKEAVFHINSGEYIYPKARDSVVVKIRTAAGDIKNCRIIFWPRTDKSKIRQKEMVWKNRDEMFDYFQVTLTFSKIARYQRYYFVMETANGEHWYCSAKEISRKEPDDGWFEYLYANPNDVIKVPEWAKGAVYYHIFPERFCDGDSKNNPDGCEPWGSTPTETNYMGGDLQGIISKLGYLKELGIECIYMNPVFEADFNHKYATKNYYKIDPQFGTNEIFKNLVDECHRRDMKIILDGVFNHTGIQFPPFVDILEKGESSQYKNWFLADKYPVRVTHHSYECVGAYKWMPKLNSSNSAVRRFIIEVMEFWIREYGIDGWRLDVADEVDRTVWQEAGLVLREKYPDIILIGETWQYGGPLVKDARLDSVMNYMFRDAVRDYFGYETISTQTFDYRINHMMALYREEELHALYNLLDSHDTERFLMYCGNDKRRFRLAVAFQMLFLGAPAVFYGDEAGITGGNDPDCRQCMVWDGSADKQLTEWYRKLIQIRKTYSAVRRGNYYTVLADDRNNTFGFVRQFGEERIYAVIHRGGEEKEILCPVLKRDRMYLEILEENWYQPEECRNRSGFYNADQIKYQAVLKLTMKPYSIKVICERERSE